jgi:putative ABC transport system permease protein
VSVRTLLYFYGWRLRAHPLQELLAAAGIAIGVALLFAVQVANTSMTGSAEQTVKGITGAAQIELAARDDQGFDERLIQAVRQLDGVRVATPVLDRRGVVVGQEGERAVMVVGVDPSLAALGGPVTHDFGPEGLRLPLQGLVLPDEVAAGIGTRPGGRLEVMVAGRASKTILAAALDRGQIGPLVGSQVAIGSLPFIQRITGMPGRVSRIFVRTDPAREAAVRADLRQLTSGRLEVGPADAVIRRLRVAAAPNDQSTALFSAISAMVGLLFAFNAMLLSMPDRRAFVAELRTQGFTPLQIVQVLGFQALGLGVVASVAGIAIGDLLSRTVFDSLPTYLAFTFPIGTQRIVTPQAVVLAFLAGVLASLLATSRPLADLFQRKRAIDAVYEERGELGEGLDPRLRRVMLFASALLVALTTVLVVLLPRLTVVGVLALAIATLLAMPATFAAMMPVSERISRRMRRNLLLVAILGARSALTRSVAVAAIAALAVFGNVAIGGARDDLVRGLEAGYADHLGTADIWVTTAGQSLTTDVFTVSPAELERVRRAPGVAETRIYQGGMLDAGDQRTWIIARPPEDPRMLPASQLVDGDLALAERRLRAGGWAAVSRTIAHDRGLDLEDGFTVPTPTGRLRLRLAAVVTNLSWGPGAIILNTHDYRRAWRSEDAAAIEVDLEPGITAAAGRRSVERALGRPALDVETRAELESEFISLLHEGLARLGQIATLMLLAAILALAAAMSASVWQRRQRLAAYKIQGFKEQQLRRILLFEAVLVLAIGCALGVVAGVYGHLLGNRWLELTTGFPAPFALQGRQALFTLLSVTACASAIVAIAGYFAARVSARLSFRE